MPFPRTAYPRLLDIGRPHPVRQRLPQHPLRLPRGADGADQAGRHRRRVAARRAARQRRATVRADVTGGALASAVTSSPRSIRPFPFPTSPVPMRRSAVCLDAPTSAWQQRLIVDASAVADLGLRTAVASLVGAAMLPTVAGAVLRPSDSRAEREALGFYAELADGTGSRRCRFRHPPSRRASRRGRPTRWRSGWRTAGCSNIKFTSSFEAINPAVRERRRATSATTSCTPSTGRTTTGRTPRCV